MVRLLWLLFSAPTGRKAACLLFPLLLIAGTYCCFPADASALFLVSGKTLIYDSHSNLYWYSRPTDFSSYSYNELTTTVLPHLSIPGYGKFRVADETEVLIMLFGAGAVGDGYADPLLKEFTQGADYVWAIDSHFYEPFAGGPYLSNVVLVKGNDDDQNWGCFTGMGATLPTDACGGAWVVGEAQAVPEPSVVLLIGIGLAGAASLPRKKAASKKILDH